MAQKETLDIIKPPCPRCGKKHEKLPFRYGRQLVFRGTSPTDIFEIVLICPETHEEFRVTLRKRKPE